MGRIITLNNENTDFKIYKRIYATPKITLKDEDELIDVRMTDGQDNVVLVTHQGLCITFGEKDVRPIGRVAQGVIGIRLSDEDEVIGMESVIAGGKATLLAITGIPHDNASRIVVGKVSIREG